MPASFRMAPLALAIGSALALGSVRAATITVDTLDDSLNETECSLRAALASVNEQEARYGCSAPDGLDDEIVFGGLTGTIALNGEQLEILEPVRLIGPGPNQLEISGQGLSRVLLVTADSEISGVTISNGSAKSGTHGSPAHGGGIHLFDEYANLHLEDCRVIDNAAGYGGGLGISAGRATVSDCVISGNTATSLGGGIWVDASLNERSGLYMTPYYGYQGYARLDINDTVISGNHAEMIGGGVAAGRASFLPTIPAPLPPGLVPVTNLSQPNLTLSATTVEENSSTFAGGLAVRGPGGVPRYFPFYPVLRNRVEISEGSVVAGNQADYLAGGISARNSDLTIQDSSIESNTVSGHASSGGIFFVGFRSDEDLAEQQYPQPHLTIESSTISGNIALSDSQPVYDNYYASTGGLSVLGATHSLEEVLITNNEGFHVGGLVLGSQTTGTVLRSRIAGNAGQVGGALVHFWSSSEISLSRIEDNAAESIGGLGCAFGSQCQIRFSSVTGNSGEIGGVGADLVDVPHIPAYPPFDDPEAAQITIESSTVSSNTGSRVGGIDADWLLLRFSTVANNVQSDDPGSRGASPPVVPIRPAAAGLLADGTASMLDHSIVADNQSAGGNPDLVVLGTALPVSFAVLGTTEPDAVDDLESVLNVSARLAALSDNGSAWNLSHLPLPGSPALGAGDPDIQDPPPYDQRGPGFARILDGRINIGSVEGMGEAPFAPVAVPVTSRLASSLLAGGLLLLAWLGLRRRRV